MTSGGDRLPGGLRVDEHGAVIDDSPPEPRKARPEPPSGRPPAVVATAAITVIGAVYWLVLSGLQAIAFMATQANTPGVLAVWNAVLAGAYGWIAWSVWTKNPKGCSWAMGTHGINVPIVAYQAFTGAACLVVAVPIHIAGAVAAWFAYKAVGPARRDW